MSKVMLMFCVALAMPVSTAMAATNVKKAKSATAQEAKAQQAGKAGSCIYSASGAHNKRSPHSVKVAINSYLGTGGKASVRPSGKVSGVR